MVRILKVALLLTSTLVIAPSGWAQSLPSAGPSADQIINTLKPTTESVRTAKQRGVRRLDDMADPSAFRAAPAAPMAQPRVHAAASMPQANPPQTDAAPSVSLFVQFESGSAELTHQAMASLDNLGRALSSSELTPYRFRIEGHTDTVGSKDYNLNLSEHRAAAVARYIEQKYGVNEARLDAVGVGSEHLLVPTPPQTPEAKNRRVQVVNLGS